MAGCELCIDCTRDCKEDVVEGRRFPSDKKRPRVPEEFSWSRRKQLAGAGGVPSLARC